jgi:hypothetical protein
MQVLDRLNALFEPGGELVISERGLDSSGMFTLLLDKSRSILSASFVLHLFFEAKFYFKIPGQICTIRPHPNFRVFMAMNSISGEVSQPMRNRGLEISILPGTFSRADAVQVALAAGVTLQDTAKLIDANCDIRRANFVAETACALGGSGCSMDETLELIQELHPVQVHQPIDSPPSARVAYSSTSQLQQLAYSSTSQLQQPSLHAWLNHPHQSKFLRICCSVASIAQHMNMVSESNSQQLQPSLPSPPSLLAAASAFALFGSSQNYEDIGRVLNCLPPNAFLELVSAGITHMQDQIFKESDDIGSFDLLLGYLGVCSTSNGGKDEVFKIWLQKNCSPETLRAWFSLVLAIDSVCMRNQGNSGSFISSFCFVTYLQRIELD